MRKINKYVSYILIIALIFTTFTAPSFSVDPVYKISGYITPDFTFSKDVAAILNSNFKVEVVGTGISASTDDNGYFELLNIPKNTQGYTMKISKDSFLSRYISNLAVTSDIKISTQDKPIKMWCGDVVNDETINMTDIIKLAKLFNTAFGDGIYVDSCDFNKDKAINISDVMIIAKHFNQTSEDYGNNPVNTPVTGINLDKASISMMAGESQNINATVTPAEATNKKVLWTSSDAKIAIVDGNGLVTGIAAGTAVIKATTEDGNFYANCNVTVKPEPAGLKLDKKLVKINVGEKYTLKATLSPAGSTGKIIWSSTNTSIASVDQTGVVIASSVGEADVLAATEDGSFKTFCNVIVVQPVKGMSIDKTSMTLKRGDTAKLTPVFVPSNASNKNVKWVSSDSNVVTVGQGGVIMAVATGTATVTATSEDGSFSATSQITVIEPTIGVRLDKSAVSLKVGDTYTFTPTISPLNASNKNIIWTSSNANVATVDNTGKVTAKSGGTAIIKASPEDGLYSEECRITVVQPVTAISLNKTSLKLKIGNGYPLKPQFTPANADNKNIKWTSSDKEAVEVDEKGIVKAIKKGTVIITATSEDGGFSATCSVTTLEDTLTPPANLRITSSGAASISLAWDAAVGTGITYTVRRATAVGEFTDVASNISATNYQDSTIASGTTYYYVVCASNAEAESRNSNMVQLRNAPQKAVLFGEKSTGNAVLAWSRPNGADRYEVYRKLSTENTYMLIAKNLLTNTYEDENIGSNIYSYKVIAINEKGSAESNEVVISNKSISPVDFAANIDSDGDGLANVNELLIGTSPMLTDTDRDGLGDGYEMTIGTNPVDIDTDKDGLFDGSESALGTGTHVKSDKPGEIKSQKQITRSDGRTSAVISGDGNIIISPLQIIDSENKKFADITKNKTNVVTAPFDIIGALGGIVNVSITYNYDPLGLNNVPENNLCIMKFDNTVNKFEILTDSKLNTAAKVVNGSSLSICTFVIGDKIVAPSAKNIDIIFYIDVSASARENDQELLRYQVAKLLAQCMAERSLSNFRYGVLAYDDEKGRYFAHVGVNPSSGENAILTNDINIALRKLDYLCEQKEPVPNPIVIDYPFTDNTLRDYFGDANTSEKIIVGFSSGPLKNFGDILSTINYLKPAGVIVNTVGISPNAQYDQLSQITAAGADGGKAFAINNIPGMTEDQVVGQITNMCSELLQQFDVKSYVEGAFKPQNAAGIDFNNGHTGTENDYLNEWISGNGSNLLTGNYMEQHKDINIQSTGYDISFERSYNSMANDEDSIIGNGFRTNYDSKLEEKTNTGIVTSSVLNIRSGPGTNYPVIGKVTKDSPIEIIKKNASGVWHNLNYKGNKNAYASGEYIDEKSTVEVTYPTGTKTVFKNVDGKLVEPAGCSDTLVLDTTKKEYILTKEDKSKLVFDSDIAGAVKRLKRLEDRSGNSLTINYLSDGKIDTVSDITGRKLKFNYKTYGKLDNILDPLTSRKVKYDYLLDNGKYYLSNVTDGEGKATKYEYDGSKRINKVIDANDNAAVRIEYDLLGRMARQYDAEGNAKYIVYNDLANERFTINENGKLSRIRFNIDMRPVEETDALGNKNRYEYSYYDAANKKYVVIPNVDMKDLENTSNLEARTYRDYITKQNAGKLKTKETIYDAKGKSTVNEYDEYHNLISTKDAKGITSSMVYYPGEGKFNLWKKTDKNQKTYEYIYDDEGVQIKKELDPMGNETEYIYYPVGGAIKLKGLVWKVTERRRSDQTDPKSALVEFKVTEYKYEDPYNDRTEIIDSLGNHTYETYDAAGRLKQLINARGFINEYDYDNNDRVKAETIYDKTDYTKVLKKTENQYDYVGNKRFIKDYRFVVDRPEFGSEVLVTETVFDCENKPIYVYDPQGYRVSYKYDPAGNKTEVINQRGFSTKYRYNDINQVYEMEDALKNITGYDYDANGNVIKVTEVKQDAAKQAITNYEYDELNRKIKVSQQYKDDSGKLQQRVNEVEYDGNDNVVKEVDPLNKVTKHVFDAINRETSKIDGLDRSGNPLKDKNNNTLALTTTYQYEYKSVYDSVYEVMTEKNELPAPTVFNVVVNDSMGHTRKSIDTVKAYETTNDYDEVGNLKVSINAKKQPAYYEYDAFGKAIKITDAKGYFIEAVYDSLGNNVEKIDQRKNKTRFTYDKLNRPSKTTTWYTDETNTKQKIETWVTYDPAGNKRTATDALYNTTRYDYDGLNRLVAEADPLSNVKYTGYDEFGREIWETDRKNHKSTEPNVFTVVNDLGVTEYRMRTVYTYDDLDMLRKVTNALGEDTEYKYDLVGNIKEIKDGEKRTTTFDYNPVYMLVSKTDGDSKTETYDSYDLLGNLLQKTDRNKNVHVYTYNEFYKVGSETVTGVGISDKRNFYYDAVGNMYQITDETGTTVFTYDVLNKLDYKTLPGNKVIDYDYDEAGNLRYLKDPNGNETNYKYDELNRLKTVSTVDGTATYAYYLSGSRKSLTLPNKTVTTYEYDARNVLTKLANTIGTENTTYEYSYDENKLQTSKIEPKGKTSFVYDDLGRLKNVTEPGARVTEYAYDHAGNRSGQIVKDAFNKVDSNIAYHYNGANRLTDTLEVRNGKNIETIYQYDNNGNQTKVTVKENEAITESNYTYDGFNQLRKASSAGNQDILSKYNALGQRTQKTVGNVTTIFYYDDKDVILETRSDGVSFWNVQGVNLIARKTGNDVLYYNYNGHGDVVKVTDKAGARVNEYDYDVFGNSTYTLETKPNPYKYCGYYFDDETGYYYLNARFYDPKIARFISEDTYSGEYNDPLSLNLYTYCQNDPLTYSDPNGHWLHIAIGALVGGIVNTAITAASDYIEHGKFTKGFKDYAGAFVEGAAVGGAAAATGGTSLIALATTTTVASMAGNAAKQLITTGKVDLGEVAFSGAGNLIGMGAGKALSVVGGKIVGNLAKTAFGKSVIAKAKSLTSKVMSKVSGVTTKIKSLAYGECKHPNLQKCFTGDTLVKEKNGFKPISKIKVGDKVYAQDADTGEKGLKEVKKVFVNDCYELVNIFVGKTKISTTVTHSFFVVGKGWVQAGNLRVNDKLQLVTGEEREITKVTRQRLEKPIKVYNFEVEDWHTYYVSKESIYVHNGCGPSAGNVVNNVITKPYKALKNKIAQATTNAQKGQIGEEIQDLVYTRAGYTKLPSKVGSNNGYDGLFVKFSEEGDSLVEAIVNESKFGSSRLGKTKMGKQMSDSWIQGNLEKMLRSPDRNVRRAAGLLQDFIDNGGTIIKKLNRLKSNGVNRWKNL